jgi:hypothetical protein
VPVTVNRIEVIAMNFQPTPAQVEWLGAAIILSTFLATAEKAWNFLNTIVSDCQRQKRLQEKRKVRQAARAARRLAAKRVPMPKPAIGVERFPANRKAQPKLPGQGRRNSVSDPKNALAQTVPTP